MRGQILKTKDGSYIKGRKGKMDIDVTTDNISCALVVRSEGKKVIVNDIDRMEYTEENVMSDDFGLVGEMAEENGLTFVDVLVLDDLIIDVGYLTALKIKLSDGKTKMALVDDEDLLEIIERIDEKKTLVCVNDELINVSNIISVTPIYF